MIEVERKFLSDDVVRGRLIDKALEVKTVEMLDVYYDDADLSMTLSDRWLRSRCPAGQSPVLELKVPVSDRNGRMDVYEEVVGFEAIAGRLGLDLPDNSAAALAHYGLVPFAEIRTRRLSLAVEERGKVFHVDLDEMDFGYAVGEVELLVEDAAEVSEAEDAIFRFSKSNDINITTDTRGKLVEYIRRKRPEHYRRLLDSGILARQAP